jgi:hypothetical protein
MTALGECRLPISEVVKEYRYSKRKDKKLGDKVLCIAAGDMFYGIGNVVQLPSVPTSVMGGETVCFVVDIPGQHRTFWFEGLYKP